MKTIYLSFTILLMLIACSSSKINFNTMSNAELAAYNQNASTWDQVFCRELEHVRSRIPRRRCDTRMNWQLGVVRDVTGLGTADTGKQKIGVN
jgi:hypothetical protein